VKEKRSVRKARPPCCCLQHGCMHACRNLSIDSVLHCQAKGCAGNQGAVSRLMRSRGVVNACNQHEPQVNLQS
jgi:hypothetical protein